MSEFLIYLPPVLLALGIVVLVVFIFREANKLREEVEKALDEAKDNEEEQAEIRKKVVRAMFPPRFPLD